MEFHRRGTNKGGEKTNEMFWVLDDRPKKSQMTFELSKGIRETREKWFEKIITLIENSLFTLRAASTSPLLHWMAIWRAFHVSRSPGLWGRRRMVRLSVASSSGGSKTVLSIAPQKWELKERPSNDLCRTGAPSSAEKRSVMHNEYKLRQ